MAKVIPGSKGLIIGKFLPPHLGHQHLIDFAKNYVEELTVLVCSLTSEPIPGELRYKWMKEMFPGVKVIHVKDENPQEPEDHPKFWNIWKKTIKKAVKGKIDFVFASEIYGKKLAEMINAEYIPVNEKRDMVKISGTDIRKNPFKYWEYIPQVVKPYFVKKVCVFGPESTGKTILTRKLAKHFKTVYINEYARDYLDFKNNKCVYKDIEYIARGHLAYEDAMAKQANKLMFCDTDLITTNLWSNVLFKKCPKWIKDEANKRNYDLYLLLNIDTPWIKDPQRYLPDQRKWFMDLCVKALKKRNRKFVIIKGSWTERFKQSVKEVKKLLK